MKARLLKGLSGYNYMDEYYSMPSETLMSDLAFLEDANEFHSLSSTFGKGLLEPG